MAHADAKTGSIQKLVVQRQPQPSGGSVQKKSASACRQRLRKYVKERRPQHWLGVPTDGTNQSNREALMLELLFDGTNFDGMNKGQQQ